MKKYGRVDANQRNIVNGLRNIGATVHVTSSLGNGFVDIVVGYRGFNFLFEIKDKEKPLSKKRLTENEKRFFETWRGQCNKIESVEDAILIMETFISKVLKC